MTHLQVEVKRISRGNPIPEDVKMTKKIESLNRIAAFYRSKAEIAPKQQSNMFSSFASTITYSVTILSMYRNLTKELAELAKESETSDIVEE